jgi:carbonic anhydrase/acetyltransferase-like protein (isoleucine patch superfamily)
MIHPSELVKHQSQGLDIFIAENAMVFGNVFMKKDVSVWFGASIRGDADKIDIGEGSNVQDLAVIHADPGYPCIIGSNCIIGHSAIVHGATLESNVLVGMRAVIMNGAKIGEFSIIGAGAIVTENTIIPPYSLVLGMPAKVIKSITDEQKQNIINNAKHYVNLSKLYLKR